MSHLLEPRDFVCSFYFEAWKRIKHDEEELYHLKKLPNVYRTVIPVLGRELAIRYVQVRACRFRNHPDRQY